MKVIKNNVKLPSSRAAHTCESGKLEMNEYHCGKSLQQNTPEIDSERACIQVRAKQIGVSFHIHKLDTMDMYFRKLQT